MGLPRFRVSMLSLMGCAALVAGSLPAVAQNHKTPENISFDKKITVQVIGASLADQLATGLRWRLRKKKGVTIRNHSKPATGLIRTDVYDWQSVAQDVLAERDVDMAIVALGGNDRQSFFRNGKRLKRFSVLWRAEYYKRLDRFMRQLTARVPVVYWVGLPVVRAGRMNRDFRRLNGYFRKIGEPLGVRYIDIYSRFLSKKNGYVAFGEDLSGRNRRLRDKDGIHFTMAGARVLGDHVVNAIMADLENARRRGRTVELRGTAKN